MPAAPAHPPARSEGIRWDPALDARILKFACPWADRGLVERNLSGTIEARGGTLSPRALSERVLRTLGRQGFRVVLNDLPAEVPTTANGLPDQHEAVRQIMLNPQAASPASWSSGIVVGERELHVDARRRRNAFVALAVLTALFLVLVPSGFLIANYVTRGPLGGWLYLIGAFCGITAFFASSEVRVFESEVLIVSYRSSPTLPSDPSPTPDGPRMYDLRVAFARVRTKNGPGRREFRRVRGISNGNPESASVAQVALSSILDS